MAAKKEKTAETKITDKEAKKNAVEEAKLLKNSVME